MNAQLAARVYRRRRILRARSVAADLVALALVAVGIGSFAAFFALLAQPVAH